MPSISRVHQKAELSSGSGLSPDREPMEQILSVDIVQHLHLTVHFDSPFNFAIAESGYEMIDSVEQTCTVMDSKILPLPSRIDQQWSIRL